MNHYDILEVSQKASQEVIRAAYKSLIHRCHPDRNPGDKAAAMRSVLIVEAYRVLSDPGGRVAYDIDLRRQVARHVAISASAAYVKPVRSGEAVGKRSPRLVILTIVLAGVTLWVGWLSFGGKRPVGPGLVPTQASPPTKADATDKSEVNVAERPPDIQPRTIPGYVEDLKISLATNSVNVGEEGSVTEHVLFIRSIGITVGSVDTERFIGLLLRNRGHVSRVLTERLAVADYKMLTKPDGERYLKNLVLDALGEITKTNRYENYSPAGGGAAIYYGAVDVSLPESFVLESTRSKSDNAPPEKPAGE